MDAQPVKVGIFARKAELESKPKAESLNPKVEYFEERIGKLKVL